MTAFTPRQLRLMADRLEGFTKARTTNTAMGVPATPDAFAVRFPDGTLGVCSWAEAELTSEAARQRHDGNPVHRYVLDLGPNQPGTAATGCRESSPAGPDAPRP